MSRERPPGVSPPSSVQTNHAREIYEYHGGVNSVTILGEALGQHHPNRFVKIILLDDAPKSNPEEFLSGLDATDLEYLGKKGALTLPSSECW